MKVGVIGYGEIGKSIHQVYKDFPEFDVRIKEKEWSDDLQKIEIMNVCISFGKKEDFVFIVSEIIKEYGPLLTIIHSTVKAGTTKEIINKTGSFVVHSPVIGVHPNLYEGIKTFVKYIGYEQEEAKILCEEHFRKLNLKYKSYKNSKTSELAKLLSTTYYGVCIAWHGEMKKICDKEGVNFEAIGDWNKNYREGYEKLGKSNVARPILSAPEGKIGGHCVIPNAKLLSEDFESLALDLVLKYG